MVNAMASINRPSNNRHTLREKGRESAPDALWRVLYEKLHKLTPNELRAYIDAISAQIERLEQEREFAQHIARGDPYNPPVGYNEGINERSEKWTS